MPAAIAGAALVVYGYVQRSAPQVLKLTITITQTVNTGVMGARPSRLPSPTSETYAVKFASPSSATLSGAKQVTLSRQP